MNYEDQTLNVYNNEELGELFRKVFPEVELGYVENREGEKGGVFVLVRNPST